MQNSTDINDIVMSLDELINACGQERAWVLALIEENIIMPDVTESKPPSQETKPQEPTQNDNPQLKQHFSGYQLAIVRRASRLSRDFEASVPSIGLILELIEEVESLRQLKRQVQPPSVQIVEVNWE